MKNIKTTHNVFRYANTILTIVTVAIMFLYHIIV